MSSISGTEASEILSDLSLNEREKRVLRMVKDGDVPDFIKTNYWFRVTINKNGHELWYLVSPYFAVGDDEDPLDFPLRPTTLQQVADEYDSIIPSKLMIKQIQDAADIKIPFQDVKGKPYNIPQNKIESYDAIIAANNMANKAFDNLDETRGSGNAIGYKKSVVTGPNLDGSKVAIYGARVGSSNESIQPYSTIHEVNYVDYSHGGVLVSRKASLDGEMVDLREDVFGSKDPDIYGLVSDQGRFDPVFPNAGKNSLAQFSKSDFGDSGTGNKSDFKDKDKKKGDIIDTVENTTDYKTPIIVGLVVGTIATIVWIFA